jgi:hypothetical protein
MISDHGFAAVSWDAEYAAGRSAGGFHPRHLRRRAPAAVIRGLYIGCGNGRNYLPLVAGGLDLTGLDISSAAIAQLAARAPDRRDRLVVGDLSALPAQSEYPLLIGIQMFQHGDRAAAHAHIRAALSPRTRSSSPPPRSNARPSGLPNRSNPSAMRAIGPRGGISSGVETTTEGSHTVRVSHPPLTGEIRGNVGKQGDHEERHGQCRAAGRLSRRG